MMLSADRVQETSSTTGTGAIALAGATLPSMSTFASAFANGSLVGYAVLNQAVQTEWEKGIGTYSANSIARTYVTGGSNGTQPVNFSAGDKLVLNVAPAATVAVDWSPSAVYVPGDTAQDAGTLWYALNVNVGSEPSLNNSNWAAMGGGSGGYGTVTSVGLAVPSWLSVSNSPVTSTGTLAVSAAASMPQARFLATPAGASGPVELRAIVASDIPILNQSTTGSSATAIKLATPRAIAGVAFDGSADISLGPSNIGAATAAQGALAASALQSSDVGSAAYANVPTSGNASPTQVVLGSDSRLVGQGVNNQSGITYTAAAIDDGLTVISSNATGLALTLPLNATVPIRIGAKIAYTQGAAGQVTITGAPGVTVNAPNGNTTGAQWDGGVAEKIDTDTWQLWNGPAFGPLATIADAPSDGNVYGRKNGAWAQATGSGVTALTPNEQTGTTYTLAAPDSGKFIRCTNSAAIALTIPANATAVLPIGVPIPVFQGSSGVVTVSGASGVTLESPNGAATTAQGDFRTLFQRATDVWVIG